MKMYELKNNKALGRYEFDLGGATAAVDYEECGPGCIAVTHTGVPDRFCGQGIASQLTLAVVGDLKRQGGETVSFTPLTLSQRGLGVVFGGGPFI